MTLLCCQRGICRVMHAPTRQRCQVPAPARPTNVPSRPPTPTQHQVNKLKNFEKNLKKKNFFCQVLSRKCMDNDWVSELLYDGCFKYNNEYLCVCSSSYCNGGNLQSIRGNDDCARNPCPAGSMCLDTHDGFKCMCPPWQSSCTYR